MRIWVHIFITVSEERESAKECKIEHNFVNNTDNILDNRNMVFKMV